MNASRYLTVRNLPEEVASALDAERRRRGVSLNQTVVDLLRESLGVGGQRSNGLARLAGTWSAQDLKRFQKATEVFSEVDPELWK